MRVRHIATCGSVWRSLVIGLAITFVVTPSLTRAGESWIKGSGGGPPRSKFGVLLSPLDLHLIECFTDGRLVGHCAYYNETDVAVTLRGRSASDGTFCPSVTLQVSDSEDGGWRTIQSQAMERVSAFVISPHSVATKLLVRLDAFRPLIGKAKYGRLLLDGGEAATFSISRLSYP